MTPPTPPYEWTFRHLEELSRRLSELAVAAGDVGCFGAERELRAAQSDVALAIGLLHDERCKALAKWTPKKSAAKKSAAAPGGAPKRSHKKKPAPAPTIPSPAPAAEEHVEATNGASSIAAPIVEHLT